MSFKRIRLFLFPVICLLFPLDMPADPVRDLVRIYTPDKASFHRVLVSDLDIVYSSPGDYVEILAAGHDIDTIRSLRLKYETITPDIGRVRAEINRATPYPFPPFADGSMGGFYTYDEAIAIFDSLHANDPHGIISGLETIGTGHLGNDVVLFKISDNAGIDEDEPEVLYTGLHHAREPMGLMSLIFFVDHLLENYGIDPEITYLVDNRELYFVPIVNPDGYKLNESTYFTSGTFGYRRKNARDNDNNGRIDHFDGVDLNRNYGYMWGYDDIGSSPISESGTYRGPSPFSEPETEAIRTLANEHEFLLALNYHSYSNLMIYPWGYNDTETADSLFFRDLADRVTEVSSYQYGTGMETVGYRVNGDSDDWMYGEEIEKPPIFAMTPEIGDHYDGFWPARERIYPLAYENLLGSLHVARVAGAYLSIDGEASVDDDLGNGNGFADPGETVDLVIPVRNLGLTDTLVTTVARLSCTSPAVDVIHSDSEFGSIVPFGEADNALDPFRIALHDSLPDGERIWFILEFSAEDGYVSRDSFEVIAGTPEILFTDDAEGGMVNFESTDWGIDSRYAVSGDYSFSDSPGGDYEDDTTTRMTLVNGLDLSGWERAYLIYQARWFIQMDWDIAKIQVSRDGSSWETMEGTNTIPGSGIVPHQNRNEEGYHSNQLIFKKETVDLSDYTGPGNENVTFRFTLTSGSWTEFDGIYVDDIEVRGY